MKIKIIIICFECESNPSSSIHGHSSSHNAKISFSEILCKELNLNLIKFNPFLQLILILIEKLKKKKILNET